MGLTGQMCSNLGHTEQDSWVSGKVPSPHPARSLQTKEDFVEFEMVLEEEDGAGTTTNASLRSPRWPFGGSKSEI